MRHVKQGAFSAYESVGLDDSQEFSSLFRRDEARGLITVNKTDHGTIVCLTKTEKAMQNEEALKQSTPSLSASDDASKAVQKTPWRVSLASMERAVANVEYIHPESIPHMTIAVVLLHNGYALQGMSAPADPANFNEELGRKFAYEDAMRKMWPLEAYVMRDVLTNRVALSEGDAETRWAE
jgi:hypothetical protein